MVVAVLVKMYLATGKIKTVLVKRILPSPTDHPHEIKVQLDAGEVGRVKKD